MKPYRISGLRNSYNAEFGLSSGGIVNAVTKSGTNSISGSVFGFTDDKFDARKSRDFNPEDNRNLTRQQFGGGRADSAQSDAIFFTAYERFNPNQSHSLISSIRQITPSLPAKTAV